MSSPYGPPGGNDPQQQWGQQPYGGGAAPGTPSRGGAAQPRYPQQPRQPHTAQPSRGLPSPRPPTAVTVSSRSRRSSTASRTRTSSRTPTASRRASSRA